MTPRSVGIVTFLVACAPPMLHPPGDAGAAVDGGDAANEVDASTAPTGPDPSCDTSGCVRAATKIIDYPREALAAQLDPNVEIDNGFSVWSIEYVTDGLTSLATVTVPYDVPIPARGWSIVANNHGTTGLDDACATAGLPSGSGLAGLFGARGMIGVASDYPGIGTPGLHPYLVLDVESRAVLDALRAARSLALWQRVPVSGRFAVVGVSQGGHATIGAAALHEQYAPELDIRAFAGAAPQALWLEHWQRMIANDGFHLTWHAMVIYSWSEYYGYDGPTPWAVGIESTLHTAMTSRCTFPVGGMGTLFEAIGTDRSRVFNPAFLLAYQSGAWGAYESFATWFSQNRVRPYRQTAPLRIYQGDADGVVPEADTRALVEDLRAAGVDVEYEVVPGGTHTDIAFGNLKVMERRTHESIAWIRSHLDGP